MSYSLMWHWLYAQWVAHVSVCRHWFSAALEFCPAASQLRASSSSSSASVSTVPSARHEQFSWKLPKLITAKSSRTFSNNTILFSEAGHDSFITHRFIVCSRRCLRKTRSMPTSWTSETEAEKRPRETPHRWFRPIYQVSDLLLLHAPFNKQLSCWRILIANLSTGSRFAIKVLFCFSFSVGKMKE